MNMISTASSYWKAECYTAAENGESFYVPNFKTDDVSFFAALVEKFPQCRRIWGVTSFYFNPPTGVIFDLPSDDDAVAANGDTPSNPYALSHHELLRA